MSNQSLYLRVPVVIFAVLVGGIYVYARSGGQFFTTPAQVTPAAEQDPHAVSNSLMMGSKSAPAFLPEEPPPAQADSSHGQPTLLPGSKSRAVIDVPASPPTNNPVPVQPIESPRLLPGSKSVILADPPRLLPGSKSDVLVSPPILMPAPQGNQPKQQAVQLPIQRPAPSTNNRGK